MAIFNSYVSLPEGNTGGCIDVLFALVDVKQRLPPNENQR